MTRCSDDLDGYGKIREVISSKCLSGGRWSWRSIILVFEYCTSTSAVFRARALINIATVNVYSTPDVVELPRVRERDFAAHDVPWSGDGADA